MNFFSQEKELKAAADATLSEVRKKLGEARRCKEVLERLTKLRQVRKDAMERMGKFSAAVLVAQSINATELFFS